MQPNAHDSTKDTRRVDLLNKAGELLAMRPTASLADIATYAGISKATLHRYFANRDDLMLALGYRALELVARAFADAEIETGSVIDALTRVSETLVPLGDKLHLLWNESLYALHPDFAAAEQATQEPMLRLIKRGQANSELRDDLSAEWLMQLIDYALFAVWVSVYEGYAARRDAARMLLTTLLDGIASRS